MKKRPLTTAFQIGEGLNNKVVAYQEREGIGSRSQALRELILIGICYSEKISEKKKEEK